jgi:hypothetical protein
MANFKVVFVYSQPTNKGFSEVFYRTASDIAGASNLPIRLLAALTSTKAVPTILRKCRVSDTLNSRSTALISLNLSGTAYPVSALESPEPTGVAAVVNLNSLTTGATRRLWLRGLADVDVGRNVVSGADQPSANLITNINNLISQLNINGFTVRSLVPLGAPPQVNQPITVVGGVIGSGMATITFAGVNPVTPNQRLLITRMSPKLFPGLNGYWNAVTGGANQFTIRYNLDQAPPAVVPTGQWRPVSYNYGLINPATSAFDHFGTRTTGAGFTPGRGRKRGIHLRSL